ncbi:MAG: hypothetical protein DMF61_25290 [Blastocatellia bacterium AA13]|nr:MAG: hypothetical protein DMF61_25290 [Blastocatellia bacterium AA13]
MSGEIIVLVTSANGDEASKIAEALVRERLAACVNIISDVESVYRWEGKVARDREMLLVIKTTADRYSELEQRIHKLHSYSTPEVVAIPIQQGSANYLTWLRESVER